MTVLVGADPELFIKNKEGRFRSAHGVVPGNKHEPFKVSKGAIQVDGLALEFNIDPAASEDEFVDNISTVLKELRKNVDPKFSFAIVPTARFHGSHLKTQPKEALELGCEPDFNVYTMGENPRPDGSTTLRTAAGHLHIGFTEGQDIKDPEHILRCATLAKHLDLFLGLPSLSWDKDKLRRSMYGKAGCIRVKPYGLEYRTLSNAWLKNEQLVRFVYRQIQRCVENLKAGGKLPELKPRYSWQKERDPYVDIQNRINNSRRDLMETIYPVAFQNIGEINVA